MPSSKQAHLLTGQDRNPDLRLSHCRCGEEMCGGRYEGAVAGPALDAQTLEPVGQSSGVAATRTTDLAEPPLHIAGCHGAGFRQFSRRLELPRAALVRGRRWHDRADLGCAAMNTG